MGSPFGDDDTTAVAEPNISVQLRDVLKALSDAIRYNRTWLSDFENDEIQVSTDLYEVISAYNHLQPSA